LSAAGIGRGDRGAAGELEDHGTVVEEDAIVLLDGGDGILAAGEDNVAHTLGNKLDRLELDVVTTKQLL